MINSHSCDLLIRIKNASQSGKKQIVAPFSNFSVNILKKLKDRSFISDFSVDDAKKIITISSPKINGIEIISRPGRHLYKKHSSLPWGKTKSSLIIVSTSTGLLSQKEASVKKLGGEIIAEIW